MGCQAEFSLTPGIIVQGSVSKINFGWSGGYIDEGADVLIGYLRNFGIGSVNGHSIRQVKDHNGICHSAAGCSVYNICR